MPSSKRISCFYRPLAVQATAVGLLVLTGSGALAQADAQAKDVAPGTRFEVRADDLPAPGATPSAINPPTRAMTRDTPQLRTLPDFTANVFAEGFDDARWLAVAENGDVFLAESEAGRITLLRDDDGDGTADTIVTYAEGFKNPHGMALRKRWLYVADTQRVRRLPYRPGLIRPAGPTQLVTAGGALGPGNGHWTRNLAFHPDGTHFYVAIGSGGNLGEEPLPRASVQEFTLDASHRESFATGLRNPVGIAFYPGTKDLYVVVNERDQQGDGLVPDYLTRLHRNGFYGWPYAYIGPHPQPGLAKKRPDMVKKTILPDLLFESHSAPLGLVFYGGGQFPKDYHGDAFVALHGSWNAAQPRGYMVVRVPFKDGRSQGHYEAFVTGFWTVGEKTARVVGRPAGLALAKDGSLLIADDVGNRIWRVAHTP